MSWGYFFSAMSGKVILVFVLGIKVCTERVVGTGTEDRMEQPSSEPGSARTVPPGRI